MATCPRCRNDVDAGKHFCEHCGAPQQSEQVPIPDHTNAPAVNMAKGDTGVDRSVTAIDTSVHTTKNIDDRSTRQTTITTDDHSVRQKDDHSIHQ